jgi:hypothetical protein
MDKILLQLPKLLRKDVHPVAVNSASEALLKQIFGRGRCLLVNDPRKLAVLKNPAASCRESSTVRTFNRI